MINKINWKVRFLNKAWVITFIAALFVLITAVAKLFGFEIDLKNVQDNLIDVIYAVFGVLTVIGVVVDGTTDGIGDSPRALNYTVPGGEYEEPDEEEVVDEDEE